MVEPSVRHVDEGGWVLGVAMYFAHLAFCAVLCPCADIFDHVGPPEPLGNEVCGGLNAWVGQIV